MRDQTVVIAKGAHTPHCDPETVTRELVRSLDDLRTDRTDLYFLHRDNVDVPVDEFVDVLNEHHRAGRIDAFGGSNWTAARIDAANTYADARGLVGFTALSNQFSLARMLKPTFPGCVGANDPDWRDWLARTQMPVVAWSSQAGGFFAERDPRPMRHAWHDVANLERRRRASELGARLGHPTTTVALAWVLAQPLSVLPVIGPRSLGELRASLGALDLARHLSAEQLAWLDLETDDSGH